MKSSTYIRTHDNIHNTYLKNYFFFLHLCKKYLSLNQNRVSNENRDIYSYFPQSWRQHTSGGTRNEEWISSAFLSSSFQSETDFVRQVSSCMLRCATSRVTRRRKLELWKFRRASTPLSLSLSRVFAHWNSGRQVWRLI